MSASQARLPTVKCLIVDDLPDNLFTMSALLQRPGVEVLTAASGAEALELLLVHDVALALLDVQMPGMDGFELAELMRGSERTREVPLIFVTAGARDAQRLFKGYDSGAVDFLYKPVEPWMLLSKAQIFFDLYRRKQQLAQELHERAQTLQLHEMFSAMLAHDLRDPLSAMLSAAHLISRQSPDPAVQRTAQRILDSGESMGRMVSDMLDLTRGRIGGGIPLQKTALDLAPVLERVVAEQRLAHPGCPLQCTQQGSLHGHWDGDRLAQVLSNLMTNACQHGRAGNVIGVHADGQAPDGLSLSVDSGGHIDPALLPHLFDPFRARTQPRRRGGLGLGLYIVRQIVQAHGGTITVDNLPGERTRFAMWLPRRTDATV